MAVFLVCHCDHVHLPFQTHTHIYANTLVYRYSVMEISCSEGVSAIKNLQQSRKSSCVMVDDLDTQFCVNKLFM